MTGRKRRSSKPFLPRLFGLARPPLFKQCVVAIVRTDMAFSQIEDDIERAAPMGGSATLSYTAEEEIIAGQVVKADGDFGLVPSDTDGENATGVATQNVPSGDAVTGLVNGSVAHVRAGLAVTAGDPITSHGGSGEEGEVAPATSGDTVIGQAQESISAGEYGVATIHGAGGEVN